jgi:hypothetical protein
LHVRCLSCRSASKFINTDRPAVRMQCNCRNAMGRESRGSWRASRRTSVHRPDYRIIKLPGEFMVHGCAGLERERGPLPGRIPTVGCPRKSASGTRPRVSIPMSARSGGQRRPTRPPSRRPLGRRNSSAPSCRQVGLCPWFHLDVVLRIFQFAARIVLHFQKRAIVKMSAQWSLVRSVCTARPAGGGRIGSWRYSTR